MVLCTMIFHHVSVGVNEIMRNYFVKVGENAIFTYDFYYDALF